jgi:hypothetical protein
MTGSPMLIVNPLIFKLNRPCPSGGFIYANKHIDVAVMGIGGCFRALGSISPMIIEIESIVLVRGLEPKTWQ